MGGVSGRVSSDGRRGWSVQSFGFFDEDPFLTLTYFRKAWKDLQRSVGTSENMDNIV